MAISDTDPNLLLDVIRCSSANDVATNAIALSDSLLGTSYADVPNLVSVRAKPVAITWVYSGFPGNLRA